MLGELPALIAAGYEQVPEEDLVRLKWWGLYHDKPKIGTFMLRIKLPAGRVTPAQLRADRRAVLEYGKGVGRALDAADDPAPLPRARLAAGGLPPARRGRADDRRRVRRRRPERDRLPRRRASRTTSSSTSTPVVEEVTRVLLREPRLLRPAAQAQDHHLRVRAPLQRAGDQLHRARRRAPGRRAGLRRPRRRRPLVGAPARARPRASSSASTRRCRCSARSSTRGRKTSRYRVSRVKARLKFMVDDIGPEGMRAEVERRLGYALARLRARRRPPPLDRPHGRPAAEAGRPRLARRPGRRSACSPASRWSRSPSSPSELGRDVRVTRQQNFVLDRRSRPADVDARRRAARGARAAARQGTRFAPKRSRAPASRTATSPSRRPSRGSPPSSSTSRHASATPSPA